MLWTGWAFTYAAVYSSAGGIFHFSSRSTLGPPLAALAAVGASHAWVRYRGGGAPAMLLPGALLVTALWQVYVHSAGLPAIPEDWHRRLPIWALGAVLVAAVVLVALAMRPGLAAAPAAAGIGVGRAALAGPPARPGDGQVAVRRR